MQSFTVRQACRLPLACMGWLNPIKAPRAATAFGKACSDRQAETKHHSRQLFCTNSSVMYQQQPPSPDQRNTSMSRRSRQSSINLVDPVIVETDYSHRYLQSPTAWIESLDTLDDNKVGFVTLSPHIWFQSPRIDVIFQVIKWQNNYKKLLVKQDPVRSELKGGTKKPWPQKGTGRARFKDNRGPGWQRGGVVHGMRGPQSYYYMLTKNTRVKALVSALSIKLAQNDLHVVDSFDSLPTNKSDFLEALAAKRNWGLSVLFVDDTDVMPENISEAAWNLDSFTLMPVYGLNVYSILKHDTLVITLAGLRRLEQRIKSFQTSSFTPDTPEADKINNITK